MSLRVIEVYGSYQGEGPNTSRPTTFVRFAGCNFKCPLWPCDTQHAIDPKLFKDKQRFLSPAELADEVFNIGINNVCLTGGEVFLQNKEALIEFTNILVEHGIEIECFTNGALKWYDVVVQNTDYIIMDWKLPGSGESYENDGVFRGNFEQLNCLDAIKFTIADRNDYETARDRYIRIVTTIPMKNRPTVFAGVVWGKLQTEELCKWMLEDQLDWSLNVQVHKFIWHPDKIGV
jgi:7-carboxy-7-deazaguanine synthase